jgi:hypothetical protein
MSINHDSNLPANASPASTSLDLSGLPDSVAAELRNLVATLRASFPPGRDPKNVPIDPTSAEWARRLQEWVESHPPCKHQVDDDRETIYAGRGE